jgi:dihydroorotate dehydrogenase (NAD+) catalytic subunit
MSVPRFPSYDRHRSYDWNYEHAPPPVEAPVPDYPGEWTFCGLPVGSPLGVPAGPLLNSTWCLYYASLGFDVLTYKTVRSVARACYPLPNLQPVECGPLHGGESDLLAADEMAGTWAVSYGMPSREPGEWREDVRRTRDMLPSDKILSVSVVGTMRDGWGVRELADDYALCARWGVASGADCIEINLSCPNVATCEGQLYQQPEDAARVARTVRAAIGPVPMIAKIGRETRFDRLDRLLSSLAPWVDAMAMTNSIAATVRDRDGRLLFDGERRGICGAATREASIEQTGEAARLIERGGYDVRLIGVGGAADAADVRAYLDAGAHAVHIATAAMVNPAVAIAIRHAWR